jgi:hypothetical protein
MVRMSASLSASIMNCSVGYGGEILKGGFGDFSD